MRPIDARSFPRAIKLSRFALSLRTDLSASAISNSFAGFTSMAASPNSCFAPGISAAITGQPNANASNGGKFRGPEKNRIKKKENGLIQKPQNRKRDVAEKKKLIVQL